mmetsp:Transcript_109638/g.309939  ORF Transcript_109638/g.309939 Transcript_109638/m.309939 type:complete len:270 (-) Transcript_109638:897-1706(-)
MCDWEQPMNWPPESTRCAPMVTKKSRTSYSRSSIMSLAAWVEVIEAEQAVSHTKLGPFMLKTKLNLFATMDSAEPVPALPAPAVMFFGMTVQSSLSLPTAHPAWKLLRLATFLVMPTMARFWAPVSRTRRCTGSMPPASEFDSSKCRLSKYSTPSQKDWCLVVVCQLSNCASSGDQYACTSQRERGISTTQSSAPLRPVIMHHWSSQPAGRRHALLMTKSWSLPGGGGGPWRPVPSHATSPSTEARKSCGAGDSRREASMSVSSGASHA